jgi:hypothetical protein
MFHVEHSADERISIPVCRPVDPANLQQTPCRQFHRSSGHRQQCVTWRDAHTPASTQRWAIDLEAIIRSSRLPAAGEVDSRRTKVVNERKFSPALERSGSLLLNR